MKVPPLDLRCQYLGMKEENSPGTRGDPRSQQFILRPRMEAPNNAWAACCGCGHAVGVSSGTNDPTAGGTVMNREETES
jgi:hypothetical protein